MTPEETEQLVRSTAKLMGDLLIARKDVKAVETGSGWIPEREPCPKHAPAKRCAECNDAPCVGFKMGDFRQHLTEKRCLGTYLLDENDKVKFFALDLDLQKKDAQWWDVVVVGESVVLQTETTLSGDLEIALHDPNHTGYRWARVLLYNTVVAFCEIIETNLGLPTLPVITGGGAHILVPFGSLTPAREARGLATEIMEKSGWKNVKGDGVFWRTESPSLEIEVFPKQDTLSRSGASFGNLIRLPLGWHRGANVRTYFLDRNRPGPAWALPKAKSLEIMKAAAAALGVGV